MGHPNTLPQPQTLPPTLPKRKPGIRCQPASTDQTSPYWHSWPWLQTLALNSERLFMGFLFCIGFLGRDAEPVSPGTSPHSPSLTALIALASVLSRISQR